LIINAYNLIDGVDGLAGTIALCASGIFTYLFVMAGDLSLATIAIALCGSLIAFLRKNFSSKQKLFMGDTGSMVVGFLLAVFTVSFIHMAQSDANSSYYRAAPALALALLFYPLIDTLRIFFIRLFVHKTSPFRADKNHIHHRFIQAGFSHVATTLTIAGTNILIVIIAFNLKGLYLDHQIFSLLVYGSVLYLIPFAIKKIS
jgi:UDP-N-acetylmuramyl pentapeptide phosphotransferase/UDP-N-acetylglucosamine-1-phosphate transferase